MAIETEAKVKVDSHETMRARLRAIGAQCQGSVLEMNRLFDDDAQTLFRSDRGLRIRTSRRADGTLFSQLTYKGPQGEGRLKQREEIETSIADPDAAGGILAGIGYRQVLCFEKRRETWLLDGCRVELDELPRLGCFVEIEGPEPEIRKTLLRLGLDERSLITQTYVAMLFSTLAAGPCHPIHVTF